MVEVMCPACGKTGRVAEEHLGRKATCPKCHSQFILTESAQKPRQVAAGDTALSPPPPSVVLSPAQEPRAKEPEKPKGLFGSLFGQKQTTPGLVQSYGVVYKGGHPDYQKEKGGKIDFNIYPDRFEFLATMGTKGWFKGLMIRYDRIQSLEIVERQVGTVEGLLGGLSSRQLNRANNIHITYEAEDGQEILLRLEMLSCVTVMGQAKKCQELMDRLRTHRILEKFRGKTQKGTEGRKEIDDIPTQIEKLAALREKGILTPEEFERKKSELLSKM